MRPASKVVALGFLGASALAGFAARPSAPPSPPGATPPPAVAVVAPPTSSQHPSSPPTNPAPSDWAPVADALPPTSMLPPPDSERPTMIEVFYGPFGRYGEWVLIEGYGRCWRPRVAASIEGWHPYSRGRWVATDLGWVWSSGEDWGERRGDPYHYGGWMLDVRHGWVWAPDVVWAPSRVEWRSCDGWVGWAPLRPPYRWAGAPDVQRAPGIESFVFVPEAHLLDPLPFAWHARLAERGELFVKAQPIGGTVSVGGVVVNVGPAIAKVSVATGVKVTPVKIGPVIAARGAPAGHGAPGVGAAGGHPTAPGQGHAPAGPTHGAGHGGHR